MNQVVTIGLDIAKSVFQVHGVDAQGAVVLRQRLTRSRMVAFFEAKAPCLVGMEACSQSPSASSPALEAAALSTITGRFSRRPLLRH